MAMRSWYYNMGFIMLGGVCCLPLFPNPDVEREDMDGGVKHLGFCGIKDKIHIMF